MPLLKFIASVLVIGVICAVWFPIIAMMHVLMWLLDGLDAAGDWCGDQAEYAVQVMRESLGE